MSEGSHDVISPILKFLSFLRQVFLSVYQFYYWQSAPGNPFLLLPISSAGGVI